MGERELVMHSDLVGIILAGGKSSRLGVDKVALRINKESLLLKNIQLLRKVVSKVVVVGRNPEFCGAKGVEWFEDLIKEIGPIGGIFTALFRLRRPLVVISCDLPFLTQEVLSMLVQSRDQKKAMTTFFHEKTGFIESLVAIYEFGSLNYLQRSIQQSIFKINAAIPEKIRKHISWQGDNKVFFNVNYPSDLVVLGKYELI